MPYSPNEQRVSVLKRDHDESTARTIAALEQIENRLLDTRDRRPLRDDENERLAQVQDELLAVCYPDAPRDPGPMPSYAGDGAPDTDGTANASGTDTDGDGLATGDRVRMLCGPCEGMEGVIVCPDAGGSYTMQTDAGASLTVDPCDVDVLPARLSVFNPWVPDSGDGATDADADDTTDTDAADVPEINLHEEMQRVRDAVGRLRRNPSVGWQATIAPGCCYGGERVVVTKVRPGKIYVELLDRRGAFTCQRKHLVNLIPA